MRFSFRHLPIALISAVLLVGPAAASECDNSTFSGRYGVLGSGFNLVDFHGQPDEHPMALVALLEADGQGRITHWREMLLTEAQFNPAGEMTHDGSLLRNYHDLFEHMTYEVNPDCTFHLKITVGDFETGLFGLLVEGGRQALVLSEMDGSDGVAQDVASGMFHKLDMEAGGVTGRIETLEGKVDALTSLLKLIAQRMSIVVPEP